MSVGRMFFICSIFFAVSLAWQVLGFTTQSRSDEAKHQLNGSVAELWGSPERQQAPSFSRVWTESSKETRVENINGVATKIVEDRLVERREWLNLERTELEASMRLDQRRKGLVWFSLYDVAFDATWVLRYDALVDHSNDELEIAFRFPNPNGVYDDFHFEVDGRDLADSLSPVQGVVSTRLPLHPGQQATLHVTYKTRGRDEWSYVPNPDNGVARLENFHAVVSTDFAAIDFPESAMSPSTKEKQNDGWRLDWKFARVLTGHTMGVATPKMVQPGELASSLSHSAPISLALFFLVLMVLSVLQGHDIHPVNYAFIAAAFFAFHLLFAYTADVLPIEWAFGLASGVSVALVVGYLRLVVSASFAFREVVLAQLVYQVGFSLAHFFAGRTGLCVTVMMVATLGVMMQLTGKLKWGQVLDASRS